MIISIHASTRDATYADTVILYDPGYFNPRIHEGCDPSHHGIHFFTARFQSTHPRGMRLVYKLRSGSDCLFQSTHPRGMRPQFLLLERYVSNFNPRIHEGCDEVTLRPGHVIDATFQSTHPRGMRHTIFPRLRATSVFQSTHPRGMRLFSRTARAGFDKDFNPRIHEGCDTMKT